MDSNFDTIVRRHVHSHEGTSRLLSFWSLPILDLFPRVPQFFGLVRCDGFVEAASWGRQCSGQYIQAPIHFSTGKGDDFNFSTVLRDGMKRQSILVLTP